MGDHPFCHSQLLRICFVTVAVLVSGARSFAAVFTASKCQHCLEGFARACVLPETALRPAALEPAERTARVYPDGVVVDTQCGAELSLDRLLASPGEFVLLAQLMQPGRLQHAPLAAHPVVQRRVQVDDRYPPVSHTFDRQLARVQA